MAGVSRLRPSGCGEAAVPMMHLPQKTMLVAVSLKVHRRICGFATAGGPEFGHPCSKCDKDLPHYNTSNSYYNAYLRVCVPPLLETKPDRFVCAVFFLFCIERHVILLQNTSFSLSHEWAVFAVDVT